MELAYSKFEEMLNESYGLTKKNNFSLNWNIS